MDTATTPVAPVYDETVWHTLAPALVEEHLRVQGAGAVVEIGVWQGELSQRLLALPLLTHLYMVDPWHPSVALADGRWYYCGPGVTVERMDDAYARAQAVTARHPGRATMMRVASVDAATQIPDGSLAVVIIDALHFKNTVMDDIAAWRYKLRPGGLMVGDDYSDYYPGVQLGVEAVFGTRHKVLGQTWWTIPDGGA